jgi:hypothetical protein
MKSKKTKVFWYKEGCSPRILVNPDKETLEFCNAEGAVLINPNEGSVKGLPLEHTYPDLDNNMIRPVPKHLRKDVGEFKNPIAACQREGDKKLIEALKYIKNIKDLEFTYKQEVNQEVNLKLTSLKKSITYNRYHIHAWILLYLFAYFMVDKFGI